MIDSKPSIHVVLCLVLLFLMGGQGCANHHGMIIDGDQFRSLYPVPPTELVPLQISVTQARGLLDETEKAVAGAKYLRRAWDERFDLVGESLGQIKYWGEAALSERWHGSELTSVRHCAELEGPLEYYEDLIHEQTDLLVAWRTGLVKEAEALLGVRQSELEKRKVDWFFREAAAVEGMEPEKMKRYWLEERSDAIDRWARRRVANEALSEMFAAGRKKIDELAGALPADTFCPVFYQDDPILIDRPWLHRNVALPDLRD